MRDLAGDRPVVQLVDAHGAQARGPRELRVRGEQRELPPGESLAEHASQRLVQRHEGGGVAEAVTIGRIDGDQSRGSRRGHAFAQPALLETHHAGEPRRQRVRLRLADDRGVRVAAEERASGVSPPARPGLLREPPPERRIVSLPAEEPEGAAGQPGRGVERHQRGLDHQRSRPAHRVEERAAGRRDLGPAGAQQHRGRDVLLERRRALARAVAAPVQALAGQIEAHARVVAAEVHVQPDRRPSGVDRGPLESELAEAIGHSVLDEQGAVVGVADRRVGEGAAHGKGRVHPHVPLPRDRLGAGAHVVRRGGGKLGERQQHARGDPGPEAGAVADLQRPREGDARGVLVQAGGAERLQLRREEIFGVPRSGGEERQGLSHQSHL